MSSQLENIFSLLGLIDMLAQHIVFLPAENPSRGLGAVLEAKRDLEQHIPSPSC